MAHDRFQTTSAYWANSVGFKFVLVFLTGNRNWCLVGMGLKRKSDEKKKLTSSEASAQNFTVFQTASKTRNRRRQDGRTM